MQPCRLTSDIRHCLMLPLRHFKNIRQKVLKSVLTLKLRPKTELETQLIFMTSMYTSNTELNQQFYDFFV